MRRIGSACSFGKLRKVIVSMELSIINSRRCAYFTSSRTDGRMKSSPGTRSGPRSKPTTFNPALVNSRAMMAPVQPKPTVTASTSFNRVTMSASLYEKSAMDCGSAT